MDTGKFISLDTVKIPDDPKVHEEFWDRISTHKVSKSWMLSCYLSSH